MAAGCGRGYSVAPVEGRVTLDGQPLAGARVAFEPLLLEDAADREVRGPLAYGVTDEQGRYQMKTDDGGSGAVVGPNRVRISTRRVEGDFSSAMPKIVTLQKEILPPRYHERSELTFAVPDGGTDEANFDLKSK